MRYILWFWQTKGSPTPPVFILHNLNHVSAFFYSCFVLPRLALAYLSLHLTPLVLLTYQHTWFCLFSIFLFFAPIIVCQTLVSTNFDFEISPPPVLSLTFCFYSFLYLQLPFHPSWLTSASLLHLPVLSLCVASVSLRLYGWVGLKRRVCGFAHHFPQQHRTRTQRARTYKPVLPRQGPVSAREHCSSAPLPSPVPRCGRDKPNGPFRLRAVVITDPSLRPLFQTHVVIKQTTCCSCCH